MGGNVTWVYGGAWMGCVDRWMYRCVDRREGVVDGYPFVVEAELGRSGFGKIWVSGVGGGGGVM